ncbi:N-acetyl sugar amidotransferase [Magnetococcus sp. PR-3]|uniref:N-acetyl sugar amidotransferase n=1 Tax=Magnetococcus sp. PR-3 TaxID=3120355 RepID=UPI002FCE1423
MKYCNRCMYPENAKPTIILDEEGVCSGCRYHESRGQLEVNWDEREEMLLELVDEAKRTRRERGNSHDCIIPVGGGKDSHYQVWLLKEKYGLNPLLVTYNHAFNTPAGNRNLENLVHKSGCDMVRYTIGLDAARRLSRHMVKTVGDITWHYHAGIRTYPFQAAVQYNIPLVFLGEHGFAELTGLVTLEDFVEHTKWTRKEHDMRGYEPQDLIGHEGITEKDIAPFIYPSDEDIARVGVRGLYISNFVDWNATDHAQHMIDTWDFGTITYKRERSFNLHGKIEDHANDVHDYLKYLKFGYGRGTDDASMEVRHGRMTREEGQALVKEYDARTPSTLPMYCDFMGMSVEDFYGYIEPMRDLDIWEKSKDGVWTPKDAVHRHAATPEVEAARVKQVPADQRTFSDGYRHLYYNLDNPPVKHGVPVLDEFSPTFRVI